MGTRSHSSHALIARLGRTGEALAAQYLRCHGYSVLARNERQGRDEIDIVAYDHVDRVHVFVEVKSRRRVDPDFPAVMGASWRKVRCMLRAARRWMEVRGFDGGFRVDLLCVEAGRVVQHHQEVGWGCSL